MSFFHIQTDVPIVNLENTPVMVKCIKQKHLGSLRSWYGDEQRSLLAIAHWESIQQSMLEMYDKDQNVVLGNLNAPFGTIMFVNLNLAKSFCAKMIESLEKDTQHDTIPPTN